MLGLRQCRRAEGIDRHATLRYRVRRAQKGRTADRIAADRVDHRIQRVIESIEMRVVVDELDTLGVAVAYV